MTEEKTYSINEAHKYFGINFNNKIWNLISKENYTEEEKNELINLAHASLLHWSNFDECKIVNLQRGEYMLAKVYTFIGLKEQALYYAKRCLNITETNIKEMEDFDIAFAYEIIARASALNNIRSEFDKYYSLAKKFGEEIKEKEDKDIFLQDFQEEPWFSMK